MKDFVSKSEVKIWIGIITCTLVISASYASVQMQIALMNQKLELTNKIYEDYKTLSINQIKTMQDKIQDQESRIKTLEVMHGINITIHQQ